MLVTEIPMPAVLPNLQKVAPDQKLLKNLEQMSFFAKNVKKIYGEHLKTAEQALVVPGSVVGNHCLKELQEGAVPKRRHANLKDFLTSPYFVTLIWPFYFVLHVYSVKKV